VGKVFGAGKVIFTPDQALLAQSAKEHKKATLRVAAFASLLPD
jgi:hypothetical protein